ncbi:putative D-aminoacyl-tRNA deacylase [Medicago truncatula]|uniref:D-aminoacyl-tRNA deacylase n=1 Tax=Medicago truncatula TaxID=3880 RepID=A0A396J5D3_MEDTR|nr:D-aminoacyl-tRNA deacylase [Medicago truncatula]RHN73319.1 putative D-aminoacyl-tRNA deacylase [Medicago truncatula]
MMMMQAQSLWPHRFCHTGLNNKNRSRTTIVNNTNSKKRISKAVTVRAMRAVVQRVASASVEVDGRIVSEIGPGLLVLVGIHDSDSDADADYICRKVLNMRLFTNEDTGKAWDHSVMQKNYQVLLVSQFTLYGFLKGNKPDFHVAMAPQRAKPFYASLVDRFRNAYNSDALKDGVFGAKMKVSLVNDGPVTMQLDSQSPKNTIDAAES